MADQKKKSALTRVAEWIRKHSSYLAIVILTVVFFSLLLSNRIFHNIGPGETRRAMVPFFLGARSWTASIPKASGRSFHGTACTSTTSAFNRSMTRLPCSPRTGLPISVTYSSRYYPHPDTVASLHQRYGPKLLRERGTARGGRCVTRGHRQLQARGHLRA